MSLPRSIAEVFKLHFGDAGLFLKRDVWDPVRQIVIKLEGIIRLTLPRCKQQFLGTGAPPLGASLHLTFHHRDHQRAFFSVTHLDLGPRAVFRSSFENSPVMYSLA
jgi:hypothetical protein